MDAGRVGAEVAAPGDECSVPGALRAIAGQIPNRLAVDSGTERITYADLVERADAVANAIHDRDATHRGPVVVLCDNGADAVVSILGVLHAGRVLVAVDARDPLDRLLEIVALNGARWIVTSAGHAELAGAAAS